MIFFTTVQMGFLTLILLHCTILSLGKRLRLPILLRMPKIECSFNNDECGINKNLENFEVFQNSTYIDGRCEYYQFAIHENRREPLQVARFQTAYFPNLDSKIGCLHIEYNVQGMNTFMFVVSQRTKTTSPRIISSNLVAHSSHWKRSKIDVQLCQQESQFIVEVLCQWCTRGSMFSISRISFAWESCQS